MKNERGLTLVELLAVLAISSLVTVLAFSIYFSVLKIGDKTKSKTNVRNEVIIVIKQLDNLMKNTDVIVPEDEDRDGNFYVFEAQDVDPTDETKIRSSRTVSMKNGNIYIDGEALHSSLYTSENSLFSEQISQSSGETKKGLTVKLVITDIKSNERYIVNKYYDKQIK